MIRIDEIYSNVFLPTVQHLSGVGLHWFDPFGSVEIKNLCNCPPVDHEAKLRVMFWDQEPVYRDMVSRFMEHFIPQYQGPCIFVTSEKNSSDLEWVKSTYGVKSAYYFFHGWAALDWYRGYNHSFLAAAWHQRTFKHRIFCANNIISGMRGHRTRLFAAMVESGLVANNMISFPHRCPFSQETFQELCERIGILAPRIQLPLIIDRQANHAGHSHRIDFWAQALPCFCHVVTETVFENRLHLTEKTFKPIVMQQPFVMVGPRHSLEYLRWYGFQTFHSIWDENYDSLDDDSRLEAIVCLLSDINSWSNGRLKEAQHTIAKVVQHNHDWFYGGFQDLLWQELNQLIDHWR